VKLIAKSLCFLLMLAVLVVPTQAAVFDYEDGTGTWVGYGHGSQRIVSLAPSVTEMLFYSGLGDRVVGRSSYCNYPPAATKLPTVGGFTDTSLEKIVALKPDLVVAYQGNSLELVTQLRALKIPVVALPEATDLDSVLQQMYVLSFVTYDSHATGALRLARANPALKQWSARLKKLDRPNPTHRPTVFYGMPGEVTYSAAPGSFIDDLITRAGGRNIVPKGKERWPQVGAEFILAAQPDWLLVSTPCTGHTEIGKASADIRTQLAKDPVWSKLKAVQQNHIVVINADVLLRPGPRILDALDQLAAALHGGVK
jgi:iron complex transport system substrate-binding protein